MNEPADARTNPNNATPGTLWVVATPLGNLDDLSPRARRILAEAPVIAAEDTRNSRKLVPARDKPPQWIALHDHNEQQAAGRVLDLLASGSDVALVSDAGTPLVSDPGFRLVDQARGRGFSVSPVPGPCAAIAALSAAGLPSDRFFFEGFLPTRKGVRRERLVKLAAMPATVIVYVPARDLAKLVTEMQEPFGSERTACVARELTKRFETIRRGSLSELSAWLAGDADQLRGEAVLLVAGNPAPATESTDFDLLARELARELPPARAARLLARLSGMDRKQAFARIEQLKERECT